MTKPFLLISDNPTISTGLGRITADIASGLHRSMPELRVGVLGGGGTWSRDVPYALYPATFMGRDYVIPDLPRVWRDFAGGQKGIVMTIWNHTWLDWLVRPDRLPEGEMRAFLMGNPFEVWGYVPIDGERADGSTSGGEILGAFDRVLGYTEYGAGVIGRTMGQEVEWLGHGNDQEMFYPRSRAEGRRRLAQTPSNTLLVGIVATNTPRKDWGLGFETLAEIKLRYAGEVKLWAHTDRFEGAWDLMEMARFYKVKTILTNFRMTNEDMAFALSGCDVTLGIGSGEGWGMPLAESLACGVPVVTGDYAGAREFVGESGRVRPIGYRVDGVHMLRRPIGDPAEWARRALTLASSKESRESLLDPKWNWDQLWPKWQEWIRRGLK